MLATGSMTGTADSLMSEGTSPSRRTRTSRLVVLRGGPPGIPQPIEFDAPAGRVTVDHYGRHEHFEVTDGVERVGDQDLPVYQWAYTTFIAE